MQASNGDHWSSTSVSKLRMSSKPHSSAEAENGMLDRDLVYDTVGCICVDQQGELPSGRACSATIHCLLLKMRGSKRNLEERT